MNNRIAALLLCLMVMLTLSAGRAFANDEQVWAALKQGDKVILLRHTHVDIREGIGHLAPGNCAEEVNLSSSGVEQAKRIGEAFRAPLSRHQRAKVWSLRQASRSTSGRQLPYGNAYGHAMGTSVACRCAIVEFSKGNGAPEEIRTPDPQIRSLVGYPTPDRYILSRK